MPISIEQHLAIATRHYAALSRFADRRERFVDALDWTAMEEQLAREVSMTDDLINDDLASLRLYIGHLRRWSADAGPDALGPEAILRIEHEPRNYTPDPLAHAARSSTSLRPGGTGALVGYPARDPARAFRPYG